MRCDIQSPRLNVIVLKEEIKSSAAIAGIAVGVQVPNRMTDKGSGSKPVPHLPNSKGNSRCSRTYPVLQAQPLRRSDPRRNFMRDLP
jgi:hypothetical protein